MRLRSVKITSLELTDFRNIQQLTLVPGPGVNVIYGDNAQGKTNLLEAVWLFTGGRSFRGATQSELLPFGKQNGRLTVGFEAAGRPQTAQLTLGSKAAAHLNGVPLESRAKLAGQFPAVVFSPEHLSLIKDGPSGRRRLLDGAISQILPRYGKHLGELNRVLAQRAALLGEIARRNQPESLLDIWDERMACLSWYIIKARGRYTARLREHAMRIYEGMSAGAEAFDLAYRTTLPLEGPPWEGDGTSSIYRALLAARREDIRLGATTIGPHRDDLEITLDGKSARAFGSQGQQRSCALALKLAECTLIKEVLEEQPVILLDDVLSELDQGRRDYLLSGLGGSQVFITCCDREAFARLGQPRCFQVRQGAIISEEGGCGDVSASGAG